MFHLTPLYCSMIIQDEPSSLKEKCPCPMCHQEHSLREECLVSDAFAWCVRVWEEQPLAKGKNGCLLDTALESVPPTSPNSHASTNKHTKWTTDPWHRTQRTVLGALRDSYKVNKIVATQWKCPLPSSPRTGMGVVLSQWQNDVFFSGGWWEHLVG